MKSPFSFRHGEHACSEWRSNLRKRNAGLLQANALATAMEIIEKLECI